MYHTFSNMSTLRVYWRRWKNTPNTRVSIMSKNICNITTRWDVNRSMELDISRSDIDTTFVASLWVSDTAVLSYDTWNTTLEKECVVFNGATTPTEIRQALSHYVLSMCISWTVAGRWPPMKSRFLTALLCEMWMSDGAILRAGAQLFLGPRNFIH